MSRLVLLLLLPTAAAALECPSPRRVKPCQCDTRNAAKGLVAVRCDYAHSWSAVRHALRPLRHRLGFSIASLVADGVTNKRGDSKRIFQQLHVGELTVTDAEIVDRKGTLPKSTFRNSTVYALSLESVKLKRVPSRALSHLTDLAELSLANNEISNVLRKAFRYQADLRLLCLRGNELQKVPRKALQSLKQLELLDLSDNHITTIEPNDLRRLYRLKGLDLSLNPIHTVAAAAFLDLSRLEHFAFAFVAAYNDSELLSTLGMVATNLSSLDLSASSVELQSLPPAALGRLDTAVLQERDGAGHFDLDELRHLDRVTSLDLQANSHLGLNEFVKLSRKFSSVRELDLGRTSLPLAVLLYFPRITSFFMEFGELKRLDDRQFRGSLSLQKIHIMSSGLRHINRTAFGGLDNSLGYLSLSYNKIRYLSNGTLSRLRNLTYLDLSYNRFRDNFAKGRFPLDRHLLRSSTETMEYLSLAGNYLMRIPRELIGRLVNLKHANFAANEIRSLNLEFSRNRNLETLNLNNNQITHIEPFALLKLQKLKSLNLAFNQLLTIASIRFPWALETVILKETRLEKARNPYLQRLKHLRVVDLSMNRLRGLQRDTFQAAHKTLLYVDLGGNPLDCSSCLLQPFVEWLSSNKVALSRSTSCFYPAALRYQSVVTRVCWSRCAEQSDPNAATPSCSVRQAPTL